MLDGDISSVNRLLPIKAKDMEIAFLFVFFCLQNI